MLVCVVDKTRYVNLNVVSINLYVFLVEIVTCCDIHT